MSLEEPDDHIHHDLRQFLQKEKTRRNKDEIMAYFESITQAPDSATGESDSFIILMEKELSERAFVKEMKEVHRKDKNREEARKDTLGHNFHTENLQPTALR